MNGFEINSNYYQTVLSIQGEWKETPEGYNLEFVIPIQTLPQKIGFIVVNNDKQPTKIATLALKDLKNSPKQPKTAKNSD